MGGDLAHHARQFHTLCDMDDKAPGAQFIIICWAVTERRNQPINAEPFVLAMECDCDKIQPLEWKCFAVGGYKKIPETRLAVQTSKSCVYC